MSKFGRHCERCAELEKLHGDKLKAYTGLVDQQTVFFRSGYVRAGKDLGSAIQMAKDAHDAASDALRSHGLTHALGMPTSQLEWDGAGDEASYEFHTDRAKVLLP